MATNGNSTILISLKADEAALARVRQVAPNAEIRVGPWIDDEGQNLDPKLMKGVDVLLCEMPPANFDEFDQLKWIQLTSAGYAQILNLPLLEKKIRVSNGLGNFDGPIAEWNIMMMLMWQRNMLELLQNQKDKVFDRDARFQRDIFGSTVGFWGYGGLARETARLAKAMNMRVTVLSRDGSLRNRSETYVPTGMGDPEGKLPDKVYGPNQIEQFLGEVDYLVLGLTLTPATKGMIGERELRMLRPDAVLINPARAAIIDEQVFIRCLQEKWIKGASLDVHYAYPLPAEHPLWEMPNIIMSPHISGSSASPRFIERIYDIFSQNLSRYQRGTGLLNELSQKQLRGE